MRHDNFSINFLSILELMGGGHHSRAELPWKKRGTYRLAIFEARPPSYISGFSMLHLAIGAVLWRPFIENNAIIPTRQSLATTISFSKGTASLSLWSTGILLRPMRDHSSYIFSQVILVQFLALDYLSLSWKPFQHLTFWQAKVSWLAIIVPCPLILPKLRPQGTFLAWPLLLHCGSFTSNWKNT